MGEGTFLLEGHTLLCLSLVLPVHPPRQALSLLKHNVHLNLFSLLTLLAGGNFLIWAGERHRL